MAKLKGPLFSFGARGKLGGALVYFPWKGINAVREYVIPANPNTTDQAAQRTHMTNAVAEWHGAAYTADDVTAWNKLAGILKESMSGFNRMVREFINEAILGNTWERVKNAVVTAYATATIDVDIDKVSGGNAPTIYWGTRKTHFPNSASMADTAANRWFYQITGLNASTLYYFYIDVGASGTDYGRTGIYQQRTTA